METHADPPIYKQTSAEGRNSLLRGANGPSISKPVVAITSLSGSTCQRRWFTAGRLLCIASLAARTAWLQCESLEAQTVTKKFEAAIPNIPGEPLLAVEAEYAPGAASVPHTHAKSAFIYASVISGAIKSKVNDGETCICRRTSFTTRIAKDEYQVYRMELEFDLAVVSSA